jgi:glycosyltransferase involved in cell wall biosynthesis
MIRAMPRVALFADCFHEVNGVALTCRQLASFAERRRLPFFSLHAGPATTQSGQGSVATMELRRGRLSFAVDTDFSFDPFFLRYAARVLEELARFRPDTIHITGPGDVGILGAIAAHRLRVPLVASWHTNIHQFAARRLERTAACLPGSLRRRLTALAEHRIFDWAMRYYRGARLILAPNADLVSLIARRTGKPVLLMRRGVDTFTLGYAGRLTPEKNVRSLADIEQALLREGAPEFRFLIVGHGSERDWLAAHMRRAEFPGVLKGEALARAYADMDAFVFPSRTDTYGNVIQEAMASGVPCIVSDAGGPTFLVETGRTGFVCSDTAQFTAALLQLMRDPHLLQRMRGLARAAACAASWDNVFDSLYDAYRKAAAAPSPQPRLRLINEHVPATAD